MRASKLLKTVAMPALHTTCSSASRNRSCKMQITWSLCQAMRNADLLSWCPGLESSRSPLCFACATFPTPLATMPAMPTAMCAANNCMAFVGHDACTCMHMENVRRCKVMQRHAVTQGLNAEQRETRCACFVMPCSTSSKKKRASRQGGAKPTRTDATPFQTTHASVPPCSDTVAATVLPPACRKHASSPSPTPEPPV